MNLPIARDGGRILAFFFVLFAISLIFENLWVSLSFFVLFLFGLFFFRDFERVCPAEEGVVYSPADGRIMDVKSVSFDDKGYYQIVIFLSVFNCHVNRIPYSGKVIETKHVSGKFLAAFRGDIDQKNERQETVFETDQGLMKVVQITGAIARRIVCRLKARQSVRIGERFGMIKFGSRTDLYVPQTAAVLVKKGDTVKGALTQMARF